jgi:Ras-related protein Rab-18
MFVQQPARYDKLFKVLLLGDSNVGKSSILVRYIDDSFSNNICNTVGIDCKTKMLTVGEETIKLTIWDTAGMDKFRTLRGSFYRNALGAILCYSVDNRESFDRLLYWMLEIQTYSNVQQIALMLVATKIDLDASRWEVQPSEGEQFAKEHGMLFLECSAKTKKGIVEAFDELVNKVCEVHKENAKPKSASPATVRLDSPPIPAASSSSCTGYEYLSAVSNFVSSAPNFLPWKK